MGESEPQGLRLQPETPRPGNPRSVHDNLEAPRHFLLHSLQCPAGPTTRLAFILLAHEPANEIIPLIAALTRDKTDTSVTVHYDAAASDDEFEFLRSAFRDFAQVELLENRVRCGWGEFSLAEAVLRALKSIARRRLQPDRVYLLSGSCYPVRPIAELQRFLAAHPGAEFIESYSQDWIVGGLRSERYEYHHWFNERKHPRLFYASVYLQRMLRLERRMPDGMTPRFGSQWWCLTWSLCQQIVELIERRPDVYHFFKTTWIPDELFFPTIAHLLVPERISGRSLTYYRFSEQAKPVVFYEDHLDTLLRLPFFFARKIGPRAGDLRAALLTRARAPDPGGPLIRPGDPATDFDIPARVEQQVSMPRAGQIFYGDQARGQWHGVLRTLRKPIVVLYGPPAVTTLIREQAAKDPSFVAFGRLLSRSKVDFGTWGSEFDGLSENDVAIRDYDRANYLARVFGRRPGIPVFQVAPNDYPEGQGLLHADERVIFVICIPAALRRVRSEGTNSAIVSTRDWRRTDWLRLFWALSLAEEADTPVAPVGTVDGARRTIDALRHRVLGEHHVRWVEQRLEGVDFFSRAQWPFYWAVGSIEVADPAIQSASTPANLGSVEGLGRLTALLKTMEARLSAIPISSLLPGVPAGLKLAVETLLEICFDTAPRAYAGAISDDDGRVTDVTRPVNFAAPAGDRASSRI